MNGTSGAPGAATFESISKSRSTRSEFAVVTTAVRIQLFALISAMSTLAGLAWAATSIA